MQLFYAELQALFSIERIALYLRSVRVCTRYSPKEALVAYRVGRVSGGLVVLFLKEVLYSFV